MAILKPGDKVRHTGEFLRNTGQFTGSAGLDRWTVEEHRDCKLCASGRYVAVLEPSEDYTNDELRHIAAANLERCK